MTVEEPDHRGNQGFVTACAAPLGALCQDTMICKLRKFKASACFTRANCFCWTKPWSLSCCLAMEGSSHTHRSQPCWALTHPPPTHSSRQEGHTAAKHQQWFKNWGEGVKKESSCSVTTSSYKVTYQLTPGEDYSLSPAAPRCGTRGEDHFKPCITWWSHGRFSPEQKRLLSLPEQADETDGELK